MRRVVAGLCVLAAVWACSSDDDDGVDSTSGEAGAGGEPAGSAGSPDGRGEGGYGSLQLGEPCVTNDSNQCAKGLGCTPNGMSTGENFAGFCRAECELDSECESDERCVGKLCVPVCAVWEDSCPEGYWCTPSLNAGGMRVGGCQLSGPSVIGEACDRPSDCAEGGICTGSGINSVCWQMCDATHQCDEGGCELMSLTCYPEAAGGAGGAPTAVAGAGGASGVTSGGAGGAAGAP